jgi:Cu/Ag efflux pump CusA
MGPINSIMGQIVLAAMTAPESVSPMELREIADFVIRPRLLTIPGVAQVIPIGGEVRQYRIAPNPAAMRALGVTQAQIETALASFGANTGGGFTDQYSREFLIRNIGKTGLSATGGGGRIRRAPEARRRRLHGSILSHPLRREAARHRYDRVDAGG